jgi:hypothetical protein
MKKCVFILISIFIFIARGFGQDYKNGIGVRGGLGSGITFKHFFQAERAMEALVSLQYKGIYVTGLYEYQKRAFDTPGLNWYYGYGGHLAFGGFYEGHPFYEKDVSYTIIGVDGIVGIEYNFNEIPINIGLDWKPAFHIIGYTGFRGDIAAFSIRYIF